MVRFHVVNSVKGGCGKSTFSLYLANHLTAMSHKTVIIDLDIGGSTWYRGFKPYLVRDTEEPAAAGKKGDFKKEETKFLNDLLYEYKKNKTREHVFKLRVLDAAKNAERNIDVVMTNPEKAACIRDEELDLLESAICSLVDEIAANTYSTDSNKTVDIIFDMPPGYEEHSEHILMHALMDLGSNLYKKYTSKKTKDGEFINPIYLYMISGVKQAALNANIRYVKRFYKKPSYSMNPDVLKTKRIFFIFNDVDMSFQAYVDALKGAVLLKDAGKRLTDKISKNESISGDSIQLSIINHIPILLSNQGYKDIITASGQTNPPKYYTLVEAEGGFHEFLESAEHLAE